MSASKQVGINQVAQYICLFKKKKWHSMVENSGELAASELSLRIWFATTENCAKWKKKRQMRHRYNAESLRDPGYGQKYWAVVKRAWSLQRIVWWLWEDWYQPGSLWSDDKKKSIRIGGRNKSKNKGKRMVWLRWQENVEIGIEQDCSLWNQNWNLDKKYFEVKGKTMRPTM